MLHFFCLILIISFVMNKRRKKQNSEDNGFAAWGGYMAAKKAKLQEQFSEDVSCDNAKSNIFQGIAIFVNGYTVPLADELKKLMMLHGGVYHHYQCDKTTHIIASNLPNCKMKQLNTLKIVKPSWIVESVKEGRLLDYRQHLLYTSRTQPQLKFVPVEQPTKHGDETVSCSHAVARNATEPNFLSEFYNHSRLHHISTMGATFKQYVSQLRERNDGSFLGRERLQEWKRTNGSGQYSDYGGERIIMHVDMDCFFVSVGLRDKPHLKGQPVAVTHAKGNTAPSRRVERAFEANYYKQKLNVESSISETDSLSEIASCSYEARKCGLKNGMFLGQALKLCPNLRTIPYDFEAYKQVSYCLYDTVASFTLDIEAVSCDEMFVDCTNVLQDTSCSPLEFSTFLRREIKDKTGCSASAGFGSNRLLARLATKTAKPDGQFHLEPSSVASFVSDVRVDDLPGVGRNLAHRLHDMGLRTCSDLEKCPLTRLQKEFGAKTGSALYKHCRGEDERTLNFGHQRKSVSAEVNYGIRFTDQQEAETFLKQLAEEVCTRLHEVKMKGRCITLKLMVRAKEAPIETAKYLGHGVCDQITRSSTLASAVADKDIVTREVLSIARQLSLKPSDLRGIGIQISRLEKDGIGTRRLDAYLTRASQTRPTEAPSCKLDEEVLAALPEDIRLEVLQAYQSASTETRKQIQDVGQTPQKPDSGMVVQKPDNFMVAQKPDNGNVAQTPHIGEVAQKSGNELICEKQNVQSEQFSSGAASLNNSMTVREVRTLVKEWVTSEHLPQPCDVQMLADYLKMQISNHNLDAAQLVLRCLCRCVHRKDSQMWRDTYLNIVSSVQDTMLMVYGARLKL